MLALTRKAGEAIIIGEDIVIDVISTKDGKVRLGITAPKEVRILRKEVYEDIMESNKQSISSTEKESTQLDSLKELLKKN